MERVKKLVHKHGQKITPYKGERHIVASAQIILQSMGYDPGVIDGYFGPKTEAALMEYLGDKMDRESETTATSAERNNPNNWPVYNEAMEFYGDPGDNLTTFTAPYELRLAWNTDAKVNRITCHKKVKESAERVLSNVLDVYGMDAIQELGLDLYGGCYNKRKMRGGNRLSTHSWGVAFDFHPAANRLRWGRDKALFAQPEYRLWWEQWLNEGWVSLGIAKNYDWMHVQAIKI